MHTPSRLLIASFIALATPLAAPAAAQFGQSANQGINGYNLLRAEHAGGAFEDRGNTWVELDRSGQVKYSFIERAREPDSVTLFDRSRNVRIQIDLAQGVIRFAERRERFRDLFRITNAVPQRFSGGGYDNLDAMSVTSVIHNRGRFDRQPRGGWVERDASGQVRYRFIEQGRTPGGITLFDRSRGATILLDLASGRIRYARSGNNFTDIYAITDVQAANNRPGNNRPGNNRPNRPGRPQNGGQNGGNVLNIDAGPIFNQDDAARKCPAIAGQAGGTWTGRWRVIVAGRNATCEVRFRS